MQMLTGALFQHNESFVRKIKYIFTADEIYEARSVFPRTSFEACKSCC